jgi:RNA polymerase sigma-70 factor (ECF subfamily)
VQIADEEVMAQVQGGDLDQMTLLFDRYQTPLYQFFRRNGLDAAASEDLVQEVFFRVMRFRSTYRAGASLKAWLYQIARNTRIDFLRRAVRETSVEDHFGDTFTTEAGVDSALEAGDQARVLRAALARLPERKREVLLLSRFQGLKYKEIADLMGCDVNTIKVRIHRSVQELREVFLQITEGRAR